MRPDAIKKFDYLYLGSLGLSIIGFMMNYSNITAEVDRELADTGMQIGSGLAMGSLIFSIVVSLAIWFLISRLRIGIVKWVLVVFFVLGLIGIPVILAQLPALHAVINLVVFLLQVAAIYFLFTPEAQAWFAEKRGGGET